MTNDEVFSSTLVIRHSFFFIIIYITSTIFHPPKRLIMICVSIGRGRHRHMIAEHKHLVEQGAKLVELRLDYISGEVNIKRLLDARPCAVVITCRRERDGGRYTGPEEQRLLLLRTAIA